jgi:spermidine/putrescine transport system ATP-binding protein
MPFPASEALTMSDRVTVMDHGCIVQSGTPVKIYQAPQERFVANFIGLTNFVEGRVHSTAGGQNQIGEVETPSGRLRCMLPNDIASGDSVVLLIRPEDITVASIHRSIGKMWRMDRSMR